MFWCNKEKKTLKKKTKGTRTMMCGYLASNKKSQHHHLPPPPTHWSPVAFLPSPSSWYCLSSQSSPGPNPGHEKPLCIHHHHHHHHHHHQHQHSFTHPPTCLPTQLPSSQLANQPCTQRLTPFLPKSRLPSHVSLRINASKSAHVYIN